jgi:hypothetical protein
VESALQHLSVGIEARDLTCPIGAGFVGGFRDEADELGIVDEDAVALREMLDSCMDVMHGSEVEVGDVHAHLCAAVGENSDCFDAVEASVSSADVAGDRASGGDIGLAEVNVVGDEEAAGADGTGAGSLVKFGAADVRAASGVTARSVAQAFELALPYVFELDAVGPGGCGSVEVDGHAVSTPDEESGLTREHGALGE